MKAIYFLLFFVFLACSQKDETSSLAYFNFDRDIILWAQEDLPVSIGIDDHFDQNDSHHFNEMVEKWENAANTEFVESYFPVSNKKFIKLEDYYFKDSDFGLHLAKVKVEGLGSNVIAACQIMIEHTHDIDDKRVFKITHGDIILNGFKYDFTDGGGNGSFDKRTIFLHEFGHFIGLGDSKSGTMEGFSKSEDISRELDIEIQDQAFLNYNFDNRTPTNVLENEAIKNNNSLSEKYLITIYLKQKVL